MTHVLHAHAGDVIVVEGHRQGEARRIAEVLQVLGSGEHQRYRVRWDDGHESVLYPGSDATVHHSAEAEEEPTPVSEP
jgi:hypothetical protein